MNSQIDDYVSKYQLSDRSQARLDVYVSLLRKWSKAYNLIGPKELEQIWDRHILDSIQLVEYLPNSSTTAKIVDLGTGAGFPGVVLSLVGYTNVTVIEKSQKKVMFLETVSRETDAPFKIVHSRIEDSYSEVAKADIITSRALTDLSSLIQHSIPLLKKDGYCLFLKGSTFKNELDLALSRYSFKYDIYTGITDQTNKVIKVFELIR